MGLRVDISYGSLRCPCVTQGIALVSVHSLSKGGVWTAVVLFQTPDVFLPGTMSGTAHAHFVLRCWPLLWGLHQMGHSFATFGKCAPVGP